MLTFSSDHTFFRSGDTHTTLSGGHGAWTQTSAREFLATYVALRFEKSGAWSGFARNRIQIQVSTDGKSFTGVARTSTRDRDDKEIKTGATKLSGKRIIVEPF